MGQRAGISEKPPGDADAAGWGPHMEDLCRAWNRGSWPFTFSRVHDALLTETMYRHCFWALEGLRARAGSSVGNFWALSWALLALLMAGPGGAFRGSEKLALQSTPEPPQGGRPRQPLVSDSPHHSSLEQETSVTAPLIENPRIRFRFEGKSRTSVLPCRVPGALISPFFLTSQR